MKMSREHLKVIVKECLLELLNEGLGNVTQSVQRHESPQNRGPIVGFSDTNRNSNRQLKKQEFDPRLDTPIRGQTVALKEAIKRESGGNSIMESIFADTAKTTLATQTAHGDSGTSSVPTPSRQEQFNGTREQVFAEENASRWANLAFMDSPRSLRKRYKFSEPHI